MASGLWKGEPHQVDGSASLERFTCGLSALECGAGQGGGNELGTLSPWCRQRHGDKVYGHQHAKLAGNMDTAVTK